jgi:hypothetical protein
LNCPQVRAKFLIKVNPILNQQVFDNFNQLHSTPSGLDSPFRFPLIVSGVMQIKALRAFEMSKPVIQKKYFGVKLTIPLL